MSSNSEHCPDVREVIANKSTLEDDQEKAPAGVTSTKRRAEDDACAEEGPLLSVSKRPRKNVELSLQRHPASEPYEHAIFGSLSVLPIEVLLQILSFLDGRELLRSRRVAKRWAELTRDSVLWKFICLSQLKPDEQSKPAHKSWEWLFVSHRRMVTDLAHAPPVGCYESPNGSRYCGDWKDGKRDGYGVQIERNLSLYEGEWKADKEHGRGVKIWRDGSRYEGEWREGKKHGRAVIKWGDGDWKGDRYEGEWKDDFRDGTYSWANGDVYQGQWSRSKINGFGLKMWANGDRYKGQWKADERHGRGVYEWPSGNRYEGEWLDGKTNGFGVKVWGNGDRYEGEWLNDNRHGRGVYLWNSGTRYEGEWREGKKDGKGTCTWSDGTSYEGDWRNNYREGRGLYTFPDGSWYDGEWCANLRHGRGVMVWVEEDGTETRLETEWVEDARVNSAGEERLWDLFFTKPWDEQKAYVRLVLSRRKAAPRAPPPPLRIERELEPPSVASRDQKRRRTEEEPQPAPPVSHPRMPTPDAAAAQEAE